MLPNPFFGSEMDKLFPYGIKNRHFIFTIFEAKVIGRKVEFLHLTNIYFFRGKIVEDSI
jgi:hypothetical protein